MNVADNNPQLPEPDREAIEATAGVWLSLRDRGMTSRETEAFVRWLQENSEHAAMFASLERTWQQFDQLSSVVAPGAVANPDTLAPPANAAPAIGAAPWPYPSAFTTAHTAAGAAAAHSTSTLCRTASRSTSAHAQRVTTALPAPPESDQAGRWLPNRAVGRDARPDRAPTRPRRPHAADACRRPATHR